MNFFTAIFSSLSLRWWFLPMPCVLAIAIAGIRGFETDATRKKRADRKRQGELRALTQTISIYARDVHQRFPTGDVVVSERDLAEQLRKRPDAVVTALNLLLNDQKVQRAPLSGYWKLNG